ncbi:hypothetical protein [Nonomuraea sp. NPDC050643]|uniref:hypothetical protein n=1 Tax=Nonomuraea sp. NPDC050643 TaxID=3155660 RepID=UPI0033C55392
MEKADADAAIGGFAGSPQRPSELLLSRYDRTGPLRVLGRTAQLSVRAATEVTPLLTPCATILIWWWRSW